MSSRAARRPAGQRERGTTIRPNAAEHLAVPPPGMTACTVCSNPGYAVLDARGVKVYHSAPWPCRVGGRFADLVSVADPAEQGRWHHAAPSAVCRRCGHARAEHHDLDAAPLDGTEPEADPTMCARCTCPGPAAITPTLMETP